MNTLREGEVGELDYFKRRKKPDNKKKAGGRKPTTISINSSLAHFRGHLKAKILRYSIIIPGGISHNYKC